MSAGKSLLSAAPVALVTGGASGLGRAVALRLARSGCRGVVALDLAEPAAADAPPAAAAGAARVLGVKGDVAFEPDVVRALDACAREFGSAPRIVVSCAGIAPSVRLLGKRGVHALDVFERTLRVNVVGTFNVMRLAADRMKDLPVLDDVDRQRGVVVNTASVAAFDGQIGQVAYSASKGAVTGMCLPAARDLSSLGIRVATVAPGVFKTPMVAGLPEEAQRSLAAAVPFPARLGDPDEFAKLVLHVCDNAMLNGEVVRLDGALRMAPR